MGKQHGGLSRPPTEELEYDKIKRTQGKQDTFEDTERLLKKLLKIINLIKAELDTNVIIDDNINVSTPFVFNDYSFLSLDDLDREFKTLVSIFESGFISDDEFRERKSFINEARDNFIELTLIPHRDYSKINRVIVTKKKEILKERFLRVFISSTFKDMQREREVLVKDVFARLKKFGYDRNIHVSFVDLRWGITSEQSGSGDTILICLNEIERCRPYFVCLLGERYGWCQNENGDDELLRKSFYKGSLQFPWISSFKDRSITELEIRHAVLNEVDEVSASNAVFLMKEGRDGSLNETVENREKLERLKQDIVKNELNVIKYKTI